MYRIAAFYKFSPLTAERVTELKKGLEGAAARTGVLGLLLLGPEGCNATVAAPTKEGLAEFLGAVREFPEFADLEHKESESVKRPFRRFKIDLRAELITIKKSTPPPPTETYLSPREWHNRLSEGGGRLPVVLDVRNDYETALGVFKGAVTLPIDKFSQFPEAINAASIPKDSPVLMYCTGGIRCEKAIVELQQQGFQEVYQLHGGILKYMEEFPEGHFQGECFVFDHRVAVDTHLQPTKRYALCPHCGDPAERRIVCRECGVEAIVCDACLTSADRYSCSKNCAYHQRRRAARLEAGEQFDPKIRELNVGKK
jgi:UPF0176 protein